MMSISENLAGINGTLPDGVKLVAISKTKPAGDILEAYRAGQRIFGENKAQEMAEKHKILPVDIEWHFVGHLQTNKVKFIAPFVSLIHSADSLKLLSEIDKEGKKSRRAIRCLLQFHIAEEETKFGLNEEEATELLESDNFKQLQNICVVGVMGMATFTENTDQIRREFRNLRNIFRNLKNRYFPDYEDFSEISMGMSDDYQIAIEEGSTMIRIGSRIFGAR